MLEPRKCRFHTNKVTFLGYVISGDGIEMDPAKVQTVLDWGTPKNVKDVQSFLGFANFYRRFIKNYSEIAAPLTALTRKDTLFTWWTSEEKAFKQLKVAFTQAPVLINLDPKEEILVETDASDFALGAVISQKGKEGRWQPVAYHSRKLSPAELNYEIYDKELLAIVDAFREWKVYLQGSTFPV